MGNRRDYLLCLLALLLSSSNCESWKWFSSSSSSSSSKETRSTHNPNAIRSSVSEFSVQGFNDQNGIRLLENAKSNLINMNSCWQSAYRHLFSGCSESLAADEKRSRFAWHLSDCFQKDSGRPPFPLCDEVSFMSKCLKSLNDHEHKVYLEFYLETNSICHQLQAHAFKLETERLVNELKSSANYAEEKLEIIEGRTESLLQGSSQLYDSLDTIDARTQVVAEAAKNVGDHINTVLRNSEEVYEQSRKIATSQSELQEGQTEMKKNLKEGIAMLQDSYSHLGQEIDQLRNEAAEIEKEIGRVGDAMSSKMKDLQNKANEIGDVAGVSLDKQQLLLDGQSTALKDLQFFTALQSQALEESKNTLQKLAEYGHRQQEELLHRQKQLQQVHDHLMDNSRSILAAQESFESKQASMFAALDKLFDLHTAMVLESRLIKAFFIYCMLIFIIYMFTSTKQTYNIRPWLYIGLCTTFCLEVAILRFTTIDIEQQTWAINVLRSSFTLLALTKFLHAIFTYRDYEVLNYQMLQTLLEKVNVIQGHKSSQELGTDINWSSWIEIDLPEDVNKSVDPDFVAPEEVGENSITTTSTTRNYNLRSRNRR